MFVNIDAIPAAAIERMEVLTDGASAVYGSDAVAGVVNIILYKEFKGTELSAQYGSSTEGTGQSEKSAALQTGFGSNPTVAAYQRGADGRANRLATLALPLDGATSLDSDGMHLSDDRRTLAVIARAWTMGPPPADCVEVCASLMPFWMNSSVQVQRVDVSNPAAAALGERLQIDGTLVDSRRIGNQLYVVTTWRPTLLPQVLPANATTAQREAAIAA
eukprot:gene1281-1788_t